MVSPGQFLERPTLIPLPNGLVLEGLSHRGQQSPSLLVLSQPPFQGSGMDHVVGAELAYAVSHQGHATLRFNYRGVGGSQGEPSRSAADWLEDAVAAMQLGKENTEGGPVVVATLGASDAVGVRLSETFSLGGLIVINPSVVVPADFEHQHTLSCPLAVIVAEQDETVDRLGWASQLERLSATFCVIPGATRTYQRNLPLVGKAAAHFFHVLRPLNNLKRPLPRAST